MQSAVAAEPIKLSLSAAIYWLLKSTFDDQLDLIPFEIFILFQFYP